MLLHRRFHANRNETAVEKWWITKWDESLKYWSWFYWSIIQWFFISLGPGFGLSQIPTVWKVWAAERSLARPTVFFQSIPRGLRWQVVVSTPFLTRTRTGTRHVGQLGLRPHAECKQTYVWTSGIGKKFKWLVVAELEKFTYRKIKRANQECQGSSKNKSSLWQKQENSHKNDNEWRWYWLVWASDLVFSSSMWKTFNYKVLHKKIQ